MADSSNSNETAKSVATKSLTDTQLKVLSVLSDEWCYPYKYVCSETELDIAVVKPAMQELKALGYVIVVRGLMDEEGQVAGSGFQIVPRRHHEVRELISAWQDNKHLQAERAVYERLRAKYEGNDLGLVDSIDNSSVSNPPGTNPINTEVS